MQTLAAPPHPGAGTCSARTAAGSSDRIDELEGLPRSGGLALAQLALLVTFCLATPAWLVLSTRATSAYPLWPLALAVAVYAGLRLVVVLTARVLALYQFAFWLFCYVFLGLAPAAEMRTRTDPNTVPDIQHSLDLTAYVVVLLGIAAWEVGSYLGSRRPARTATRWRLDDRRVVLLTLAGLLARVLYVAYVGPSVFFGSREGLTLALLGRFGTSSLAPVLVAVGTAPLAVGVIALLRQRSDPGARRHALLLAVGVLALVAFSNPLTDSRYNVGSIYLSLLVTLPVFRRQRVLRALLAAIVLVTVFGFSYLSPHRYENGAGAVRTSPIENLTGAGDYDSFDQINNTVYLVAERGSSDGRQALGVVAFFVPRSVWSDKPVDTGILLANFRGYAFTNLSAPLWAEAYVNGGYPAVVLVLGVVGFLAVRRDRRGLPTSPAAIFFSFYFLIILRGSLLQATGFMVLVTVTSRYVARRDRSG